MTSTLQTACCEWDTTRFFPEFDGPVYRGYVDTLRTDIARALAEASAASALCAENEGAWKDTATRFEALDSRASHVSTYLGMLSSADTSNDAVKNAVAAFSLVLAEISKLRGELIRALSEAGAEDFAAFCAQPELATARWTWERMRQEGQKRMPVALEGLAADLGVDGIGAWGRLYEKLGGRMDFSMTWPDGSVRTVPMAQRRALMADPSRAIRGAAFRDGQVPWITHQDTLASALNALAGTRGTLYARRKQPHFLDAPLFDSAMSKATLDALMEAIRRHVEIPRSALRLAARMQGTNGVAFFDLEAPQLPAPDANPISWDEACNLVHSAFASAYPALGNYFAEMLEKRWIESAARPHKSPGAYMTCSPVLNEERIYMTYHDTIHDVITLAHEAGHAWHTALLRSRRPLARQYPMTLAETASNFGESILLHALESQPGLSKAHRAWLLEQEALRGHSYLLNIPVRFRFESRFYEERLAGEVSATRLCELMAEAQREFYGNTLAQGGEDPYFWASKMHFFITEVSFYNFPYVFGYLLSQALYSRFLAEGPSFLPKYEAFLRHTGSASCEDCVRETLGADITTPEFWAAGILSFEKPIAALDSLTA